MEEPRKNNQYHFAPQMQRHLLMGNKKGDLGHVWMAAHFPKRLRKDLVEQTNITSSVGDSHVEVLDPALDKILVDQLPVVTYRILGFLLLGVARIYSKKVEYLLYDCNNSLNEMKIHLEGRRKVNIDVGGMCTPESSSKRSKRSVVDMPVAESSGGKRCNVFVEAMHAQLSSISLPENFELDAFDLEVVEDDISEDHVKSHLEIRLNEDAWENDRTGSQTFGKDWWDVSSSFTGHASAYATITNTNPSNSEISAEKLRHRFSLDERLDPMVLDETDEELNLTDIPSIQHDPERKNTSSADDYMIFEDREHPDKEDRRNNKYPDEECTTGETMVSEMTLVGNITLKSSPEKRKLSVSIDVTPQSKVTGVSGEHKSDFVAIRTPASKEHALPHRKRKFVYDDTIVVPNTVFKNWLADASDLVGKRRKAPNALLARKERRSFDFVLEPIIPINLISNLFPSPVHADFPSVISRNKLLVLEKVEDTMEPDSKIDELGSLNTPKTAEQRETEAIAPSTPVSHSTSLRFNEIHETSKANPTNSYESREKELFPIKDAEVDGIQMKEGPSFLGKDNQENGNQLSLVFDLLVLILKTGGYIDVKQEKAYDDVSPPSPATFQEMSVAAQSFNGNLKKAVAGIRRINLEGLRWRVFDAKGQILGRLASQISTVVQGKDKPIYTPNRDDGDMCIVLNAKDICVTGRKLTDKYYRWHTGYIGHLKERSLKDQMAKDPTEVIRKAVLRMLPRNKLRDDRDRKLRIFSGNEHPFGDKPLEPYVMPPRQVRELRPRARRAMVRAQKKAEQQEEGGNKISKGKKRDEISEQCA
ncbi:hypothetical protein L6452_41762 [Arctium lappa]|uniref:Uncharacterized protein n=1 Tax=Arctium lappa TaxID=4217 RepID=A0ACB8XNY5_ARCLA|nr:hypothetical protein L6452_41762 [Arctium lappa]